MEICPICNTDLIFRLEIKDTEDNRIKKLYLCNKCNKYYFLYDEK